MKEFFSEYKSGILLILGLILFVIILIPVFTYLYYFLDLSSKDNILSRNKKGVILVDRKERPFYSFFQARDPETVPLSEIPKPMQQAVISVEDKDFYNHPGFSIKAIVGALVADIKRQKLDYGGSTITQQLVKNVLLTPDKSFVRKYQEIVLAQEIERRYTKDEILEMYLNSVYFGEGAIGVEDAAAVYFNKSSSQLNLTEASLLAGLLTSPSTLSPLSNDGTKAKEKQLYVLNKMLEQGYISEEQKDAAARFNIVFNRTIKKEELNQVGTHFALMVKDELIREYGEDWVARSGIKVVTTLDLDWQMFAESTVKNQVNRLLGNRATNGAAVVIDPKTGEVRALVGSRDWYDEKNGKINMALSPRQPGSAFKPIIYAQAIENKLITAGSVLEDKQTTFEGNYRPKNYDGRFRGNVTVRRALANSLNIPSVEIMSKVGVENGVDFARRLGITTLTDPSRYGLSLVLGGGEVPLIEMTAAYGVFANEGLFNKPTVIYKVIDRRDKEIFTNRLENKEVINPGVGYIISSILSDNSARAEVFGNSLSISKVAAVKTGTTEDYKDALTIGYTPNLVVGVWVGNNDNTPMDNVAGSMGAAPIWRVMMERFLQDLPNESFRNPGGVAEIMVCRENGLIAKVATSSAMKEVFLRGTEPTGECFIRLPSPSPQSSKEPDNSRATPSSEPVASIEPSIAPTPSPVASPTSNPRPNPSPSSSLQIIVD